MPLHSILGNKSETLSQKNKFNILVLGQQVMEQNRAVKHEGISYFIQEEAEAQGRPWACPSHTGVNDGISGLGAHFPDPWPASLASGLSLHPELPQLLSS